MITYFKVKLFWYSIQKEIYKIFIDKSDIFDFVKELIASCEGLTGKELRNEFISALAGYAHEQVVKERENKLNDKK